MFKEISLSTRQKWINALINVCNEVSEEKLPSGQGIQDLTGHVPDQFRFSAKKGGEELFAIYLSESLRPLGIFPTIIPKASKLDPSYWLIDTESGQTILNLFAKMTNKNAKNQSSSK
jgi:hypothetical protein